LGTATSQAVIDVVGALLDRDAATGLDYIHRALDAGSDARQFARQIVDYLRDLLLIRMGNLDQLDTTAEVRAHMQRHAQEFTTTELLSVIRAFNHAANDARSAWQPALPLEMAFVESLYKTTKETPAAETQPKQKITAESPGGKMVPAYTPLGEAPQTTSRRAVPKVTSPPEEEAVETDPKTGQLTQKLEENWRNVLNLVRSQNPNTYGLLNSCRSRYIKGNILILGFASDVLKNQMDKKDNTEIVRQAISQVLETDIDIRSGITAAKRNNIPPEVDSDGMVAAALRDLGGEIVDVQ
jgi:DNA polymerase-3 subunit gamma/tau